MNDSFLLILQKTYVNADFDSLLCSSNGLLTPKINANHRLLTEMLQSLAIGRFACGCMNW